MSSSPNYIILYEGLKIFRDAMLAFIVENLKNAYGDNWWEQGVARCFKNEHLDRIRIDFEKRHASTVVEHPEKELAEILDVGRFGNIIEITHNWNNVFKSIFGESKKKQILVWLDELREVRNSVAHPETGDLHINDAFRSLDNAERILRLINSDSVQEIQRLRESLFTIRPFILPQLDTPNFTGRENELTHLNKLLLKQDSPKSLRICVLVGAGGVGKSALACHFATLYRADFPDGIIGLRVDGKDANTIAREFAYCYGEEIDPEDKRNAAAIMQQVFTHRRVLLIFDNADNVDGSVIRALRPGGNLCAVIITTRDRGVPVLLDIPSDNQLELDTLPQPDSIQLLETLLGQEWVATEPEAAQEIIELVGNLPLALQIVGAAFQISPHRSLADYAASLREKSLTQLKIRGDERLNVRSSLALSLELLEDKEIDFLACLSVCAEKGFSLQAVMAVSGCDKNTTAERLDYLYRLSLLNLVQSNTNRFAFHPLIRLFAQELVVERNLEAVAVERHARFFIEFVKTSNINDQSVISSITEELDSIILAAEWLQTQESSDYEFTARLQPFFERYGYWEQAIRLAEKFLSSAESSQDWDAAVRFRIQEAKYLMLQGKWKQAEQVLTPIREALTRIESAAIRQRHQAVWLNELGSVFQQQGRFDKAVDAFQQSVQIGKQLGDERHLAMALNSLGAAFSDKGRPDKAISVFQESLVIREKLGVERDIAITLNSLGKAFKKQGRFDEAINALQRSLALREKLGMQRDIAIALNNLGDALQDQGRPDEAIVALQHSVRIGKDLGDKRHLAIVLNSLASVLRKQNHLDEAINTIQQSIQIGEELDDKKHLAKCFSTLGDILREKEEFNKARENLRNSYKLFRELDDQLGQARVLLSAGEICRSEHKFEEAEKLLKQSYELYTKLGDQRGQAIVDHILGDVYQRQGKLDQASDAFQRSAVTDEQLGNRRGQAMILYSKGRSLQNAGRLDEAIDAFQRSLEIEKQLGNHLGEAMVHLALGKALVMRGDIEQGIIEFRQSFEINKHLKKLEGMEMAASELIEALLKIGQRDEAKAYCQQALAIAPKNPRLLKLHRQISTW